MSHHQERTSKDRDDASTAKPGEPTRQGGSRGPERHQDVNRNPLPQRDDQNQPLDQRDAGEDRDYEGVGGASPPSPKRR